MSPLELKWVSDHFAETATQDPSDPVFSLLAIYWRATNWMQLKFGPLILEREETERAVKRHNNGEERQMSQ